MALVWSEDMQMDLRLQRELDRTELITGLGHRSLGRMCAMALVALLAGEGHTDSPACASPIIRSFVIPLNDRMPGDLRQRLKVFVPRIVGTHDGLDAARLEYLRRAMQAGAFARAALSVQEFDGQGRRWPFGRLANALNRAALKRRIAATARLLDRACDTEPEALGTAAARACGNFIAHCALRTPQEQAALWYWNEALCLIDALCDVSAATLGLPSGARAGSPLLRAA